MSRKPKPSSPLNPFYGIPAERIAEWTGLSIGTVEHFKAGRRKPPIWILRLVKLYWDGKVLDDDWEGYKIVNGKLFGPNGRHVRPSDIALMGLVWQALAEKDPECYYAILDQARRA